MAREAVRKSLVLLKNGKAADTPLLPLPKKSNRILVAGSHANNLGYQCGGWTIAWQGVSGNNVTDGIIIIILFMVQDIFILLSNVVIIMLFDAQE